MCRDVFVWVSSLSCRWYVLELCLVLSLTVVFVFPGVISNLVSVEQGNLFLFQLFREPGSAYRLRGGKQAASDPQHQTLSHLHNTQALYSVTPEIRWCTFYSVDGNVMTVLALEQSLPVPAASGYLSCRHSIIQNKVSLLCASKIWFIPPNFHNMSLHVCRCAVSHAWGNALFIAARPELINCFQNKHMLLSYIQWLCIWSSCCL